MIIDQGQRGKEDFFYGAMDWMPEEFKCFINDDDTDFLIRVTKNKNTGKTQLVIRESDLSYDKLLEENRVLKKKMEHILTNWGCGVTTDEETWYLKLTKYHVEKLLEQWDKMEDTGDWYEEMRWWLQNKKDKQ